MPGGDRSSKEIPVITVQCDWDDVIRKINGTIWVSCKYRGETSYEGKIHSKGLSNEGIPAISSSDGFTVHGISRSVMQVKHDNSGSTCVFAAPCAAYTGIHAKSVLSLDVTPGSLGVSVCTDNKLIVWDTKHGILRRTLEGHVGDVYKCRFFPSGIVVLSGGADMQLKIWSAETGQCPVTLRGHTAAITDMCMVERGRNIISVSKDGTAKLWNCGDATCLATLLEVGTTINSCSIGIASNEIHLTEPEEPPSEHEVGTENKILLLGCEDGSVHCVIVRSREKLFSIMHDSAVNCVVILSVEYFLVGCQNGKIILYNFHKPKEPVCSWYESNSAALCLLPYKEDGFFVGRADGTCVYHKVSTHSSEKVNNIRVHLTGSDCDPVYDMSFDGMYVFTACRDAAIRKYDVTKILSNLESFV